MICRTSPQFEWGRFIHIFYHPISEWLVISINYFRWHRVPPPKEYLSWNFKPNMSSAGSLIIFSLWHYIMEAVKDGFYLEGTDAFVISSNRRTFLFSWAWILNLRYIKWPKSCQIRAWVSSEGSNSKMKPYLSLQNHFRHLYDMIWVL